MNGMMSFGLVIGLSPERREDLSILYFPATDTGYGPPPPGMSTRVEHSMARMLSTRPPVP
ncbi:hypothetical protein BOTBODRAFT_32886 [Botryobasidium botryosum FD-172 SS1]|uniref:Uncharacterized protein n=1 Tax=Botryobasidium botryosum (strain FD-172 SS1) TaxID=930990 RepID=A0A067ME94_BOTB1|nr:hypothetical protein BOTBODRAFT_32886 [Botryobasidium botryosum FD-172 SS1]